VRIACPFCGERGNEEFVYYGDATVVRPDPRAADATAAFADYVYLRDNFRGVHRELWYHGVGCRGWLVVTRDTLSHEIEHVEFARDRVRPRVLPAEGER
jgi:methylglutamate dehydrogenase subunit B